MHKLTKFITTDVTSALCGKMEIRTTKEKAWTIYLFIYLL